MMQQGCAKCRYAARGCARCRDPAFKPRAKKARCGDDGAAAPAGHAESEPPAKRLKRSMGRGAAAWKLAAAHAATPGAALPLLPALAELPGALAAAAEPPRLQHSTLLLGARQHAPPAEAATTAAAAAAAVETEAAVREAAATIPASAPSCADSTCRPGPCAPKPVAAAAAPDTPVAAASTPPSCSGRAPPAEVLSSDVRKQLFLQQLEVRMERLRREQEQGQQQQQQLPAATGSPGCAAGEQGGHAAEEPSLAAVPSQAGVPGLPAAPLQEGVGRPPSPARQRTQRNVPASPLPRAARPQAAPPRQRGSPGAGSSTHAGAGSSMHAAAGFPPLGQAPGLSAPAGPATDPRASLWVPPASPYCLIEEVLYRDPWRLLLACMLLNKTSAQQVRQVLGSLLARWPTPQAMSSAQPQELEVLIRPLGLFRKRSLGVIRFSKEYVESQWSNPRELYGLGKYASDAYWMFCRGRWRELQPDDKDLKRYHAFLMETDGAGWGLEREDAGSLLMGLPPEGPPAGVQHPLPGPAQPPFEPNL